MESEESTSPLPPTWMIVGNIIGERPSGENGSVLRAGTRLFRPNARCYLAGWHEYGAVLHPHGDKRLIIFCQQRQSRKWVTCWVNSTYVVNWRITLEYKQSVIRGVRKVFIVDWDRPFAWKGDRNSREAIEALLRTWDDRYHPQIEANG